eukprot:5476164-Karenia_brevis.AAC.1
MLYGLTPPLALLPHLPWWTDSMPEHKIAALELSHACTSFLGIDTSYHRDHPFVQWLIPFSHLDSSCAFQVINGVEQKLELPPAPPPEERPAPAEPNVYTDGALTNPSIPVFGLASGGVWHPTRNIASLPLSDLEKEFALHKQCHDGLESFLYLDGLPSSSARAELLALIGSLFTPSPLHVALDNQSVVDYASYLIDILRNSVEFDCAVQFHKKPNGDLWQIFFDTLKHKGPHALIVSKTKGHALADHEYLARNPHLRGQAIHNDRVDRIAKASLHKFYQPN